MSRDVRSARHPVPTQDESQGQRAGGCLVFCFLLLSCFLLDVFKWNGRVLVRKTVLASFAACDGRRMGVELKNGGCFHATSFSSTVRGSICFSWGWFVVCV